MKVLIADDNAGFRAFLRAALADMAEEIEECADGGAAVSAYAKARHDWVLMDLRMAPKDGLVALHEILSQDRQARVVIVTSFDDDTLRRAAREAGAYSYALKDDLRALKSMLANHPKPG